MATPGYKQYIMLLDPDDPEEKTMIKFLECRHTRKKKGSYSAILRAALKKLMEEEKGEV
jgi:hypothetical protein